MQHAQVYLEDQEYIALCDLLKLAGLADTGGQAKAIIAAGEVWPGSLTFLRPHRPKIGNVAAANAAIPAFTKFTAAKKPNMMRSKTQRKKKCCRNKTINRTTLAGIFPSAF